MKILLAVFAVLACSQVARADDEICYPDPSQPAYTCHAYDAGRRAHGVSSSFTSRSLAAGRALASCQRKSRNPSTCAITRCNTPQIICEGNGRN